MAKNARKNPDAVALGRLGGMKGGPARAAKLTPEERSEGARKAVQARWAKQGMTASVHIFKRSDTGTKTPGKPRNEINKAAPATTVVDTSKKALHLCLKRIKDAKSENEIRRLTEELQRIVFHRQYQNAEN